MYLSEIADAQSLYAHLACVDISVPGRLIRKSSNVERWCVARLLTTLATAGALSYPLSVEMRDRPDAQLKMARVPTVGIEVTEAVTAQYAAYAALAEREFPGAWLEPSHFRWGTPPLSVKEMRELLMSTTLTGEPWVGDDVEREWAGFIAGCVSTKRSSMAKPGYEQFARNWLSVYDNLPLPHVDLAIAIGYLEDQLASQWCSRPSFEAIYVEHGAVIAEITEKGSRTLVLHDVWKP